MKDYLFQKKLSKWLHLKNNAKRTAVLVGLRAQESLNRYATVTRDNTITMFGTIRYSSRIYHNIFNFYPLYNLFYQASVSLGEMRVANSFRDWGIHSLKLYRAIEPDIWGTNLERIC